MRIALALLLLAAHLCAPRETTAQSLTELTNTPEQAATLFLRSGGAIQWRTAAQFMSSEALTLFRETTTMIVETDTTGVMADFLLQGEPQMLTGLTSAEVFDRAIGAMIDDMPGLMHSMYDRDDEVIGHVIEEGDEREGDAHVVYRTTPRVSGAVSEVNVMQMRQSGAGWRVVWSDELEVLEAALRGVRR
jgi:hypothetical protein